MADIPEGWSTAPPDTTLPIIKQRESGGKNLPPTANYDYPHSHASGLFQDEPRTWKSMAKEFGAGQEYDEAYQAPPDIQTYIAYRADQEYGPNSSYTWAASAPPGGYPTSRKEPLAGGIPKGWSTAKPKAPELPSGWSTSPPKTEPWRVPPANEGEIVHRQRGQALQGPQRDPGVVDPEIAARRPMNPEMAKSIADQAGLTKWAQEQYKHGILSPDALSNALGAAMGGSMQVAHDALAKIGVPERLIRDTIQYATEFAPMQGGLGLKAPVPEVLKPAEVGAPKEIPVDKSDFRATPDPRAAEVGPKAVEGALQSEHTLHRDDDVSGIRRGEEGYAIKDPTGKSIADVIVKREGNKARIQAINPTYDLENKNVNVLPNQLGPATMRDILRQYQEQNPGVELLTGSRSTGARAREGVAQETSVPLKPTESVGAAATPLSQIVEHNLKTFNDDNARTPGFKESLRSATNAIKSFTAPEAITDPLTGAKTGQEAAAIYRRREGQETQQAFQARAAMDKFSKFTNSLNLDEQLSLIKWMQKPGETEWKLNIPSEARQFGETFKKWMDTYKRKLQALPQTEQMEFRENYVPQMWKQPDQARAALFSPARTGNKGFTKQHVFEDYEEGIRAGFVPVSTNPMEIFSRYVENASKFIADKEIINDAKEADLMRQLPIGTAPPEGWLPVNARSQPGTQLYAPKGFAEVYNNIRSSLPQGSKGDLLKATQLVANKVTSVKLALSYFHAMLETGVSWASGLANAITKLARGSPATAGLELGKTPFKPFTSYFAARKAWTTYLDGEFGDPQMRRIVQGLVNANFDFLREGQLADEYRASRLPGFIKSWARGRLKQQARDAFANIKARPLTGTASEVYDLAMRSVETTLEPVFQYYVPWLKTQAAVDAARTVLEARPDITPLEFDAECRKISDNMDARFGEMNRNNIFWSQTQKAIAQSMLLSYSYTYGLAKNILGAGFDIARLPSRAVMKARGMSNEMIWTDRMSFAIGLPVTSVLTNAIYQYLKTGNAPQTIDQAMQKPQTGGTNEGQPQRATIPNHINSYINFFLNPTGDMFNKLNPLWQTMIDLSENKDYREKQIVDPQDPVVKRIVDGAKFAAEQMGTPVAFEGQADKKDGSNISGLETFFGIRPAGMRDTNPDQFNQMMNYKDSEAKFKARVAAINDRRVQRGEPRLIFKHSEQQKIIGAYMQHPEEDPLAAFDTGYGGTQ